MKRYLLLFSCFTLATWFNAGAQTSHEDSATVTTPLSDTTTKAAEFPGGRKFWNKYLERSLIQSLPKIKQAPSGTYTVSLTFLVDTSGKIKNIEILENPGYGVAEEAIKIVQRSPKWNAATLAGKKVEYRYPKQNISFIIR